MYFRRLLLVVVTVLALIFRVDAWKIVGNQIIDSQGRSRLFHGVDITYKSAPYVPKVAAGPVNLSFTEEDAKLLVSLGLNIVRLNVQWSGVEPIRGEYDMTYVNKMKEIVNLLAKYKIYVIIEQHQDKYSEMFCGEGFPYWASKNVGFLGLDRFKFPWPALGVTTPAFEMKAQSTIHKGIYADMEVPTPEQCGQDFEPLVAWASAKNYERLYKNEDGLQDKFTDYFTLLAKTFKDSPNVIGYELLNEPGFSSNLLSLIPGLTERWYLAPMYDRLSKAILAIIPDTLIFYEPATWSDAVPVLFEFGPFKLKDPVTKSGLDHAPNHQPEQGVLAFHYYTFINKVAPGRTPKDYFDSRQEDWKKMGVAPIVTEFSISAHYKVGDDTWKQTNERLGYFDDYLLSWTGWEYKSYVPKQTQTDFVPTCTGCGDGLFYGDRNPKNPNWLTAKNFSRPYVAASAGHLLSMTVDPETSELKFSYQMDSSIDAPTVVYCNAKLGGKVDAWYPNGITVDIQPAGMANWRMSASDPNYVHIKSTLAKDAKVTTVSVTITPKAAEVVTPRIE